MSRGSNLTKPPLKNVYRSDRARKNEQGWTVFFTRRDRHYNKYFGDSVWGGKHAALRAAIAWRDERVVKLHPPVRVRRWTPGNKTGVVGVGGARAGWWTCVPGLSCELARGRRWRLGAEAFLREPLWGAGGV